MNKEWCGNPNSPLNCLAHNDLCQGNKCQYLSDEKQKIISHLTQQKNEAIGTLNQLLDYVKLGYEDGKATMNSQFVQNFVEQAIKELETIR